MFIQHLRKEALFNKISRYIQTIDDTRVVLNESGVVSQVGTSLDDEHSILFGLDTGCIHLLKEQEEIGVIGPKDDSLYILALLFEQLIADWGNNGRLINLDDNYRKGV